MSVKRGPVGINRLADRRRAKQEEPQHAGFADSTGAACCLWSLLSLRAGLLHEDRFEGMGLVEFPLQYFLPGGHYDGIALVKTTIEVETTIANGAEGVDNRRAKDIPISGN